MFFYLKDMKWGNVFHHYLCCHIHYCILHNEKADEKPQKKLNRTVATLPWELKKASIAETRSSHLSSPLGVSVPYILFICNTFFVFLVFLCFTLTPIFPIHWSIKVSKTCVVPTHSPWTLSIQSLLLKLSKRDIWRHMSIYPTP